MTAKKLSDIIEEVEKARGNEKKVELLKANSSAALKKIIGYAMDPSVKWLIPQSDPPYTELAENTEQEGKLIGDIRMLDYFVNMPDSMNMNQIKRESLFINFLESIDPKDAKLLLRVKNKKLKIPLEVVKQAFPGISAHW